MNIIFIFRIYNGEVNEHIEEIISFIFESVKVLWNKDIVFNSIQSSINEFLNNIYKYGETKNSKQIEKMVLNDLKQMLKNKFYLFEAFLRIYEIIHKFVSSVDKKTSKNKKIILAKHKIIYFLSLIKQFDVNSIKEDAINKISEYIREKCLN